jgi:hydrogenase maturation protease
MRPATLNAMPRILIVAYGNPLRSDDGVAWRAADGLEAKLAKSEVEIVRLHQLAPEIAERANRSDAIIFIDAASDPSSLPGEIRVEEIRSERTDAKTASRYSHALSPQTVMTLAESLYGAKPRAILVTVTGANFDHGESLSAPVDAALPVLIDRIEGIVRPLLRKRDKPRRTRRVTKDLRRC